MQCYLDRPLFYLLSKSNHVFTKSAVLANVEIVFVIRAYPCYYLALQLLITIINCEISISAYTYICIEITITRYIDLHLITLVSWYYRRGFSEPSSLEHRFCNPTEPKSANRGSSSSNC